jgi:hypothetical protein
MRFPLKRRKAGAMVLKRREALGGSRASQDCVMGFLDSERLMAALQHPLGLGDIGMKYSIVGLPEKSPTHTRVGTLSPILAFMVKNAIVDALGFILAWHPTLAMLLGRVVSWLFPWLRGA